MLLDWVPIFCIGQVGQVVKGGLGGCHARLVRWVPISFIGQVG